MTKNSNACILFTDFSSAVKLCIMKLFNSMLCLTPALNGFIPHGNYLKIHMAIFTQHRLICGMKILKTKLCGIFEFQGINLKIKLPYLGFIILLTPAKFPSYFHDFFKLKEITVEWFCTHQVRDDSQM